MNATATATAATLDPADWKGTAGERWATNVDHFETMLADVATALLDHAGFAAGETVVEIGCGGGAFTRLVAGKVAPGGTVLGLDISPTLVELAAVRAKAEGVANIAFAAGDAQLEMPASAPFDRLASRFGVMFFADPAAAMANLHAMLKPGGRLDFAVWAPIAGNPWAGILMMAAREKLGLTPPQPGAPGPFAFGDTTYLQGLLEGAGFGDVSCTTWQGVVRIGGPGSTAEEVAEHSMLSGQLAEPLKEAGETVRAEVKADLARLLAPYMTPQGGVLPASVHLVTATA